MKRRLTLFLTLIFAAWLPVQAIAQQVTTLDWIDLVPEQERKMFDSVGMPAADQIIYVKFPKGAPVQELWDVIYLVGTLKTETVSHELAETAYVIEGDAIEPYDDM